MGKYLEEEDDGEVHRYQEVDSDEEKNGVLLDSGFHRVSNGKQEFNPDELYFNDMDIRAWEQRTADLNGLAYGDDYHQEDEGYYDDGAEISMTVSEYEELLFQRVLDKVRLARATGEPDVQLSAEELDAYQARMWRSRGPAVPVQAARSRPGTANSTSASTSGHTSASRSKKKDKRSSLFGSSKSKDKDKKSANRSRAASNATSHAPDTANQQFPPGFVVPGPNGQQVFTPINAYQGRTTRDPPRRPGSPRSSRSASISSDLHPLKEGHVSQSRGLGLGLGLRLPPTPTRAMYSRDMPGAFPGSPTTTNYMAESPVTAARPSSSSSSRQSVYDKAERRQSTSSHHTVSSPVQQQAPKLVPFPTVEYQHFTPEPYQYQVAGHLATSSASSVASQPQYTRRAATSPTETLHMNMPRRAPVPVQQQQQQQQQPQRPTSSQQDVGQHSYSDSVVTQRNPKVGGSDEEATVEEVKATPKKSNGKKKGGKGRRKN